MGQVTLASTCAVATACSLAATAASADIQGVWQQDAPGIWTFEYEVTNLPDFDQIRAGLPGCGLYYCVPTSTADLLAYIANHGFPEVAPGPGPWMTPSKYAAMTTFLQSLGQKMDTGASSGTSKSDWYFGLVGNGFLGIPPTLPPSKFTVSAMFKGDGYWPRLYQAGESAIWSNGLLSLCHGWYQSDICGNARMDTRHGGHCLAVRAFSGHLHQNGGVSFADYGAEVIVHDPAFDEGTSASGGACDGAFNPNAQSSTQANKYKLWLRELWFPFGCSLLGRLDRINTCVGIGCEDSSFRLVDAYLMIATKSAYSFSLDPDPILFSLKPIQFASANQQPIVQNLGPIAGAQSASIGADGAQIYVVASGAVKVVSPLRGTIDDLPEGDYQMVEPQSLVISRRRRAYVVQGGDLECIDLDGVVPIATALVTPPIPPNVVLADNLADEIVVLSAAAHAIARYAWHLETPPSVIALPASVPLGPDTSAAVDPTDGGLWFNDGGAVMHRVVSTGRTTSDQAFTLPAVQAPVDGFDVDDAGHLIVSVGGAWREYMRDGPEMVEVQGSPFKGLPGGRIVLVTHSRTNFDPAIHGGPEWLDEPPETFAPLASGCLADLDADAAVGASDLAILLGSWGDSGGPADLDGDGLVGPGDLARLLGDWGTCPPLSTTTTALSDECGTAALVGEGSFGFDSTTASANEPSLPPSCDEGAGLGFGADLWALYLPSATGTATITTCGSANFDTRLAVYAGFCDQLTFLACNDDSCQSLQSSVEVPVTAGVPLLVRVGGYNGASGQGELHIGLSPFIDADTCGGAQTVSEGSFDFSTIGANTDGPALPIECDEGFGLAFGQDVWVEYVPSVSGTATITTCGMADFDTRLAAYAGSCGALALLDCNDDVPGCPGFTSAVFVPCFAGVPILVRIGGYGSAFGTGTLTISTQ